MIIIILSMGHGVLYVYIVMSSYICLLPKWFLPGLAEISIFPWKVMSLFMVRIPKRHEGLVPSCAILKNVLRQRKNLVTTFRPL